MLVFDKKCVFANYGIQKYSKIDLQPDFGDIFYTKPHQKITPDSLVGSKLSENLEIRPKSTRKFSWVGGRGEATSRSYCTLFRHTVLSCNEID